MLILPNPNVPGAVWEIAETEELKEVVGLYGKTWHFWQVDRGDELPLGRPMLMGSFTKDEQVGLFFSPSYKRSRGFCGAC
jgi:hypothetical protein